MKVYNLWIYVFLFSMLVTACEEETSGPEDGKPEIIDDTVWEQSHTVLLGLKGNVSAVREETRPVLSSEEGALLVTDYTFDANNRLTYYNPTGIVPIGSRMIGVSSAYYRYIYDERGRMSSAEITDVGMPPLVYNILYGSIERYVGLPFPVGTYNFFLVKGIDTVMEDDKKIIGRWTDGQTFTYVIVTNTGTPFEMRTETAYSYTATDKFPSHVSICNYFHGELQTTENIAYTYDENGILLTAERQLEDNLAEEQDNALLESTFTLYHSDILCAPLEYKVENDGDGWSLNYQYNNDGTLASVTKKDREDNETGSENYLYSDNDAQGNWTVSYRELDMMVDWNHPTGEVKVIRQITYN